MQDTSVSNVDGVIEEINQDIVRSTKRLGYVGWVKDNVEPLLPMGAKLSANPYDYSENYQVILVPEVEGREWRGLNGTAGIIYRIRKSLGISKLTRQTYTIGEVTSTVFHGFSTVADETIRWAIRLGSQLPPTCKVEYEEVTEQVTRKVAKVICE